MNPPPSSRLDLPIDDSVDHVLGDDSADLTLVEYGSFACPYCHAAHEVVANLRDRFGDRACVTSSGTGPITGNDEGARSGRVRRVRATRPPVTTGQCTIG